MGPWEMRPSTGYDTQLFICLIYHAGRLVLDWTGDTATVDCCADVDV